MACPAASSSINMLGIIRENLYDDYNSGTTPAGGTRPYTIFDLVVGGQVSGSGIAFEDINDSGGYGGAGDPPGNEVSFSHFWGYDHDFSSAAWSSIFSNINEMDETSSTWESSQVSAELDNGVASNIDITSDNATHKVKYRFRTTTSWSSYSSSHLNVDWSSYSDTDANNNKIYLMFKRDMPSKAVGTEVTTTFTVTDDSASNDAAFSRTVTTEAVNP